MDHPLLKQIKARFSDQTQDLRYQQLQKLAEQLGVRLAPFMERPTQAAVLIPIVNHPQEPTLLLTQRTLHLKRHAGQISFPGGIIDEQDQHSQDCMLREVEEEIGLSRQNIHLLGELGEWPSFSGYAVTVYIGIVNPPLQLHPNTHEVEQIFEVPLSFVLNPAHYEQIHRDAPTPHHYFQILYQDKCIWGFTGGILRLVAEFMRT